MNTKVLIIIFLSFANNVISEKFHYDNYTLHTIHLDNAEHIELLKNLHDSDFRFDFWTEPTASAKLVQVMTSPENKIDLENFLTKHNINAEIAIHNVQEYIDKQTVKRYTRSNIRSMTWDAYYTLEDIYGWLEDLVNQYPDVATLVKGGESYEGRDIMGVKISHGEGKRNIFIEGGIHAREWISMATTSYIISELLTSDDPDTMAAAREFDWHIFPVTNPDGYKYTHDSVRFWRKNRRPFANAVGVDLDRNWNSNWLAYGASTNPASDTYAGPGPFSEPETRSLSRYMREIGDKMELFLTFHSYGQMLLLPFGNTSEPLANYHDAMNIGRRAMGALSVRYGTEYVTGNIVEVLYAATGGTDEWVKEHLHVPLVYCYELRDRNVYGFTLPPEQILPNSEEAMDSVLDLIHQGKRFGYMRSSGLVLKASVVLILGVMLSCFL